MINKELRESLNNYGEENEISFLLLESPSFDNSIIGISEGGRLIYDYDKMVEELMQDDEIPYDEAAEFINYNTIRALPYYGEEAPIIIHNIEKIEEMY